MTCLVFISSMRSRTFYYTNRTSLRNGIFLYPLEFQNLFYLRFSSAFDDKGFYVSNCVLYSYFTRMKQLVLPSEQYIQKKSYTQFFCNNGLQNLIFGASAIIWEKIISMKWRRRSCWWRKGATSIVNLENGFLWPLSSQSPRKWSLRDFFREALFRQFFHGILARLITT